MFGSALVPAAAFLGALYFLPESPRWLIQRGRIEEALAVISRVAGREQAAAEVKEIQRAVAEESGSMRQLFQPGLRRPLRIAVVLAVLQQITGMNTVFFYGSVIFKELMGSQSESAAVGANVIIGGVNFLATLVALWVIDKLGRRPLLMLSAAGMALGQGLIGLAFLFQPPPAALLVPAILFCAACFAVGLGPGVWLLLSELFPTRIRGRAMSIATLSLWVACVALTLTFLSLVKALTASGAFWIYSTLCLVTLVFIWRAVPETKGRTLEEIERSWVTPSAPGPRLP
jgi:sugar porter (SP) family MFS transporter